MPDKRHERTETFLGVPYDWRRKGFLSRLKQRSWNPANARLFMPKTFGWGYDINLARVLRRKPKSETLKRVGRRGLPNAGAGDDLP